MALSATSDDLQIGSGQRGRAFVSAGLKTLLDRLVWVWIFAGGLIFVEPSPYEFMFAIVLPLALFAGMKVYRSTLGLFLLTAILAPFAVIAAMQATFSPVSETIVYALTTIFLMLTAFFVASYVAEAPQERMRRIMNAYTLIALLSALAGTLGYLHIIPGGYDLFTRYGRAKALFKDPNVYGPFLILPAVYALQRLLFERGARIFVDGGIFLVLLIGVFVSFSRAAWGSLAAAAIILFILTMIFEANARDKVRMLILAMVGAAMVVVALGGLLSIPSVGALFEERAAVEQGYDSGDTGRFGRQGYAFDLALQHPWGIGSAEFRNLRVAEEPHDTYVTVLHVYGWGGGICYYGLILLTLGRALRAVLKRSANRRMLLPLIAVYVPLVVEAGIIDIDHWRHYFLIVGLIWGLSTGLFQLKPGESKLTALI